MKPSWTPCAWQRGRGVVVWHKSPNHSRRNFSWLFVGIFKLCIHVNLCVCVWERVEVSLCRSICNATRFKLFGAEFSLSRVRHAWAGRDSSVALRMCSTEKGDNSTYGGPLHRSLDRMHKPTELWGPSSERTSRALPLTPGLPSESLLGKMQFPLRWPWQKSFIPSFHEAEKKVVPFHLV